MIIQPGQFLEILRLFTVDLRTNVLMLMCSRNMVYYASFVRSESMQTVHCVFSLYHSLSDIFEQLTVDQPLTEY